MRTILISGAGGFIAGQAARELGKAGFRVRGVSRNPSPLRGFDRVFGGSLGAPLEGVFEERIDAFIHCAYHRGKDEEALNVEGTKMWAQQGEEQGTGIQVFLSSVSAAAGTSTPYARAKRELEHWFLTRKHVVLRLGLVVGDGGLFGRMVRAVRKVPLLPLLDGGKARVYVTGIGALCSVILRTVVEAGFFRGRVWNIFQPEPFPLRGILEEIKRKEGVSSVFLPLPSFLVLGAVSVGEGLFPGKLPFSRNNIIGLRHNAPEGLHSDYSRLGISPRNLAELLRERC